jgi:hypothetical protein
MSATITTSVVTGGSNSHATTSYEANAFATDFVGQGVVGTISNSLGVAPATGSFAVNAQASPAMFVDVTAGSAWITATPTGQASQALRAYMTTTYTSYAISANASGSTKYDYIYLKVDPTNAATPSSTADNVTALYTSRSSINTSDNGSPPTYGILLAVVTVANGATSITNANILDGRSQATPSAQVSSVGTGWQSISTPPTSVTYNGNRSYSVVTNSTDLTGSTCVGQRVKLTRTVTAPTQCTSLNGTTQYYSKSSPSAMTFTDDFVVSAWVKLSSYTQGTIVSRYNGTSGWSMRSNPSGQIILIGYNSGAANHREVTSYQSIPLNKWVHVAAQLDMSSNVAGTTLNYVMIDGVDVPAFTATAGTNPTALVQAGNLEIGSENGGAVFFPGKIAQVAIYNAKVTQATIKASISQTLSGSETSLISAYSFNNTINDLSANANNLTANGSAVATNADTPFTQAVTGTSITAGTTNYGIITAQTFSTNTTLTVQVPEGDTIPTSGGVSAISYSTQKVPYGFPAQRGKWIVRAVFKAQFTQSNPVSGTWYNLTSTTGVSGGTTLNIPIGDWVATYQFTALSSNATNAPSVFTTLSTGSSSESDPETTLRPAYSGLTGAAAVIVGNGMRVRDLSLAAATPHYLNVKTDLASCTLLQLNPSGETSVIYAELALL